MIASRLDHLPVAARELARRASVLTRSTFDPEELSLIAEVDEELLGVLEEARGADPRSAAPGVALPPRPAAPRGLRVPPEAAAPGTAPPARGGARRARPGAVSRIGGPPPRLGGTKRPGPRPGATGALADRAIHALTEAGDRFRRRTESRAAIELYDRALTLAGQPDEWGEREARILSKIGEGRYWLAEFESARRSLARARELAPDSLWVTRPRRSLPGRHPAQRRR